MKKVLSIILCLVMTVSIASVSLTANAEGWLTDAQNVSLDTTFSDELTESDYYDGQYYYDVFRFIMPQKGYISLRIESTDSLFRDLNSQVFSSNNPDKIIWDGDYSNAIHNGYSSARGVYYREWSVALSSGTYYLVVSSWYGFNYFNVPCYYSLTFKPSFSNTSIVSKAAKNNAFKVRWQKASSVTGYQIEYSLKSNMKSSKKVTIKKASTTAKTIKNLKNKKKYYVRVRTYKKMTVEGVKHTYYGKWSSKKTVKTK